MAALALMLVISGDLALRDLRRRRFGLASRALLGLWCGAAGGALLGVWLGIA